MQIELELEPVVGVNLELKLELKLKLKLELKLELKLKLKLKLKLELKLELKLKWKLESISVSEMDVHLKREIVFAPASNTIHLSPG